MTADEIIKHLQLNKHEPDAQWSAVLNAAGRTDFWWPDLVEDVWRLLCEERQRAGKP